MKGREGAGVGHQNRHSLAEAKVTFTVLAWPAVAKDGVVAPGADLHRTQLGGGSHPAPFYIPRSLQVVVHQPKVIGVVFMDFFSLNFQIFFFFKQSIFLGAITRKGPVGCVCVS
jgi:hypothetical protein